MTRHRVLLGWSMTACLLGLSCSPPPRSGAVALRPEGQTFRDAEHRQVLLRGVNFRGEGLFDISPKWLPLAPFTLEDCRRLATDFGMNFIRLPLNWSLLEPTEGSLDPAVLARVVTLIEGCHAFGVETLVDVHQDGWSKYVGDDGAPLWAHARPFPPDDGSSGGGSEFFQPDIDKNYRAFYDDTPAALQTAYVSMLGRLAGALRGTPGVVGLELMNEPVEFPESGRLWRFYERATNGVRANWAEVPVFFEPDASRNVSDKATPAGPFFDANAVYAPHLYTGLVNGLDPWVEGDVARIRRSVEAAAQEARVHEAGLLLGELGSSLATEYGFAWAEAAFGVADEQAVSWAAWVYEERACPQAGACWGFFDVVVGTDGSRTRGALRSPAIVLFARPFPRAVPGALTRFEFNRATRVLTVETDGVAGAFELAAPALVYPSGVTVRCGGVDVNATRALGAVRFECAASKVELAPADPDESSPFSEALAAVRGAYPWAPK